MTNTNTDLTVKQYIGDGARTEFPFPFYFPVETDIQVILTDSGGTHTTQTITTHYTVTGEGDEAGGTVTMITPPASGETLTLRYNIAKTQEVDYSHGSSTSADLQEGALDKSSAINQEQDEEIGRAFKVGPTNLNITTEIEPSADSVIGWNSSGTGIENKTLGSLGGEANTASNVGTAGVGVFKQKTSLDLEFKNINGTTDEIVITDDTGNNEVDVGIADDVVLPGTGAVTPPSGTTAQRPGTPTEGMLRYNSTDSNVEVYQGSTWVAFGAGGSSTVDGLSDAVITTPADNEVFAYDSTSGDWINQTASEAGLSAVGHIHATTDITSGTMADARIAASNVTQHQASLSITESQISDLGTYITASSTDTLTNKTFDANGVGNSITNVDLSADVTGNLPVTNQNSGTGASSATFWRGDGTWATPAGSGDVSKVGTPVDNQVGVWTGDGTIEGDTGLTWNSGTTTLAVTGAITVSSTVDGRDVAADGTKLDGIETGATADMTTEEIQDIAGPLVATGGTKTGITVTYQDATGDMDFVTEVTLSGSETLTNKTLNADNNTVSNIGYAEIKSDIVTGATADATPEFDADYVLTYDNSGTSLKKVLLQDLPGGSINIACYIDGSPTNAQVILNFIATEAFDLPSGLTGSQSESDVASTGAVTFDIKKNGVSAGTVNYAAAASSATFTMASLTSFAAGDRLELVAPATADGTLADISITLKGEKT